MKTFACIAAAFIIGFLTGFTTCRVGQFRSKTGAELSEDVTLYNEREPIAVLKKGTILLKTKHLPYYEMGFYLDRNQPPIIERKEMYYSDVPASKALPRVGGESQ
jgi:hypothetical protein